jgi:hypothetical protein
MLFFASLAKPLRPLRLKGFWERKKESRQLSPAADLSDS